jgi:hypothetical protein
VVNPQSLTAPSDARAWLIWSPASGAVVVSAQSAVVASIPGTYEFEAIEPPDAMVGEIAPGVDAAVGFVLFMTDAQKDTVLAQINSGAEFDAGVMGIGQATVLWYPDAENAGADTSLGGNAVAGFNLIGIVSTECVNDAGDTVACEGSSLVPNDTEIPIELFDSDTVDGFPALGG